MEKLIVLGTGNASVTKCYNTCSIIQDEKGKYFMIDAGGGNGILTQLEKVYILSKSRLKKFVISYITPLKK